MSFLEVKPHSPGRADTCGSDRFVKRVFLPRLAARQNVDRPTRPMRLLLLLRLRQLVANPFQIEPILRFVLTHDNIVDLEDELKKISGAKVFLKGISRIKEQVRSVHGEWDVKPSKGAPQKHLICDSCLRPCLGMSDLVLSTVSRHLTWPKNY